MGIHRSAIRRRDRTDAAATYIRNRVRKQHERSSRDTRMLEKIKGGDLPYSPVVMSWLSRQLDKPSTKITPADIKTLLG